MFAFSPAPASIADNKVYYFVGDFDVTTGKFTPDERFGGIPDLLDYGANVFTGPSAFIDPVSGDVVMFSIMQDQRSAADQGASGWAHTAGLARRIWLSEDGSDLMIAPIEALNSLHGEVLIDRQNISLEDANQLLSAVKEDMYCLRLTADVSAASSFTVNILQGGRWDCTTYTYDAAAQVIHGSTENKGDGAPTSYVSGPLTVQDGILTMELYVDRSLAEAFFNDHKALTIRAYTEEPDSEGITLAAEGEVQIRSIYLARMKPIF